MRDLFAAMGRQAETHGRAVAFDDGQESLTFGELAARVGGLARELEPLPRVVGLMGRNGVAWVVAQLAAWFAGKTVVPMPLFFSRDQLRHVLEDASVSHLICTGDAAARARELGVPVTSPSNAPAAGVGPAREGAGQIVYTSGSTGRPKGVRHVSGQLAWSAATLARASGAASDDVHLSVMPLPLLLETISTVMVPILAGARVHLDAGTADAVGQGGGSGLAEAFERVRPTTTVLVPKMLADWVSDLAAAAGRAPEGLRFVAVGGAPVPPSLAMHAWRIGIPVYEGYGLSECASVVAVNRPGQRKPGTVGKPLPGLVIRIDNGEILVEGPSVMDGYVHGTRPDGAWRTGDLGAFDRDGYLAVHGRIDNRLVTSFGRNISPEWIESMLMGDPRIGQCLVTGAKRPRLCALLFPSAEGEKWFARAKPQEIDALIARCCRGLPAYAVPRLHHVVPAGELRRLGLLTGNGRIRRAAAVSRYAAVLERLYAPLSHPVDSEARP